MYCLYHHRGAEGVNVKKENYFGVILLFVFCAYAVICIYNTINLSWWFEVVSWILLIIKKSDTTIVAYHLKYYIAVELESPISQNLHISLYDNFREHPEAIEKDLPFILKSKQTKLQLDISKLDAGRYYLKLEAEGFKKVMRVIWVL